MGQICRTCLSFFMPVMEDAKSLGMYAHSACATEARVAIARILKCMVDGCECVLALEDVIWFVL